MRQWRMRTTLMVSLLAVSLGLTATCLLIIRISVQREIRTGLDSDLHHSLSTFRNVERKHGQMQAREAALLADLPSLKALMATQDVDTIQDGSDQFWKTSGSDFFALLSPGGRLFSYSSVAPSLNDQQVATGVRSCMISAEETCLIPFGQRLFELSIQPLYFGPPSNGSQLGYVIIGYAIDQQVASEISDVAAADVAFLVDGEISATTLASDRLNDLRARVAGLDVGGDETRSIELGNETYMATVASLPAAANRHVSLVVLKSYDRASMYLKRVNRWILTLGVCALFIGLVLAAAISRTVTHPLEVLVVGTRALGQGDFSYRFHTEGAVEVRELGQAFDRMRGELQRTQSELLESDRLATIGRMASSVSHDLRHHLSAIYANAEFLSLANTRDEERTELLAEVQEAVQGMTDLIESLLLFSQTGQVLHVQCESINLLIDRTVRTVRQHPECRDVRIIVEAPQQVEAWMDSAKLGRALYNLVLNACQATRTGNGERAVTISLIEEGDQIRIAIMDTGKGIPEAIRETLFQPFVSSGKVNGTGLGLTVAQHIVQEHGGEIRLEESLAGGTTFFFLLNKRALQRLSCEGTLSSPLAEELKSELVTENNFESRQENR